ncbi:MAG: hypothetical protein MR894_01735 [Akkermansia muciniphila]|nr:hypothetical protein [Akkermansia muciniphila]
MMHPNPLEIKPRRIFILRCVRKSEHTIDYKRNRLRETLAHELYRQFRSEYRAEGERVSEAAEKEK